MGMLEGKVVGEVMAIKIAEIGAQGEERTFVIISRDESGSVSTCKGVLRLTRLSTSAPDFNFPQKNN